MLETTPTRAGLQPEDDWVPQIAKAPAWWYSSEREILLSVFLSHPRESNLISFFLIRMILNTYPQTKIPAYPFRF
ncbi:MAG: hypothetical protein EBS35_08175 [Bacteroidetes bacterium]|nr:hypothetical protein [Bacteroidota bacterium]